MSILLTLLLTCSAAVVATIHQDRRQAFRPAAERLPEELEDRIWDFYLGLIYGDNPNSPILSLEDTQALFPRLHLVDGRENEEIVYYQSDLLNQTMTEDRYLTLYVTDSTETEDNLDLLLKTDSNCEIEMRYFVANERVQQWSDHQGYVCAFNPSIHAYLFFIEKAEMNRVLEPGTEILLYIPQGCTLTVLQVAREIEKQHFNSLAEEIPASISWPTRLSPPQDE